MPLTLMPTLRGQLRSVRQSIPMLGFWMTLRYLLVYLLSYRPSGDRSFDRQHRTDTSGSRYPDQLGIPDLETKEQAVLYLPSPARVTRFMLRSLPIDHRSYGFVDYGSGKGRVALIASEFPFRKISAVEISEELAEIARGNLETYDRRRQRCRNIEIHRCDAREFPLPDEQTVFYMYHPFGADVLRAVLRKIERSLEASPRRVLILYLFPVQRAQAVFAEFEFLQPIREFQCTNVQYCWLLYSNRP